MSCGLQRVLQHAASLHRCMCHYGGVPGPSARAGGILQVYHSGTQRDISDTQTAPQCHGGAAEAAQHQEQHHSTVREPVSVKHWYGGGEWISSVICVVA